MTKKPAKPKPAKDTDFVTDIDDLPRTVSDLILAGLSKGQIRAFLIAESNIRPGVSELNELIEGAKLDIAEQAEHYKGIAVELAVVRLNDLYTRALKAQDIKTALEVQKAITSFLVGKAPAKPEAPQAATKPPPEDQSDAPVTKPRLVGSYSDTMQRVRRRA